MGWFLAADIDDLIEIRDAVEKLPLGLVGSFSYHDSNGEYVAIVKYEDGYGWVFEPGEDRTGTHV